MDHNTPMAERVGQLSQGTSKQAQGPTRLSHVSEILTEIVQQSHQIHNRLHQMIERIDGGRPVDSQENCEVDPPGVFGEVDSKLRIIATTLSGAQQWLNDLEQQV